MKESHLVKTTIYSPTEIWSSLLLDCTTAAWKAESDYVFYNKKNPISTGAHLVYCTEVALNRLYLTGQNTLPQHVINSHLKKVNKLLSLISQYTDPQYVTAVEKNLSKLAKYTSRG